MSSEKEDPELFAASLEFSNLSATVEGKSFLGDPLVIQSLLQSVIGDSLDALSDPLSDKNAKISKMRKSCRDVGKILLGKDDDYELVRHWNRPGVIDEFSAKWLGSAETSAEDRMEHCLMMAVQEILHLVKLVDIPGVLDEQWKPAYADILRKYTEIFLGVPPSVRAASVETEE